MQRALQKSLMWYALDLDVAGDAQEAVQYGLMEAGALGTEVIQTDFLKVTGYFDQVPDRAQIRTSLLDALRIYELPSSSIREMNVREVANQDWLGEWKKSWQPVFVGERFIIAPPWSELPDAGTRVVIRIEPGMAFGTGTHETTRLCLGAIEKYFAGETFLDVGTGTGILAIAAAKLFPAARVEAVDTDADAIAIAKENARLNDVAAHITFRVGSIDESTASADLVCANLAADVIVPMLPKLLGATCGRLILSGILEAQLELVQRRLNESGVNNPIDVMSDGEWVAAVV